ncbi:MAG: GTPase Era [Oligoflexia bacterium]|nr:GTPase Era [Oligoflexia bacterium]
MSFKSGFVTVIGVPNAGKSTLVNALVGESVSIVTAKPQTTRKRTIGILNQENVGQAVFVDTPGMIEKDEGLNSFLKSEIEESLKSVDCLVCLIAPWEWSLDQQPWAIQVAQSQKFSRIIYVASQHDRLKHPDESYRNKLKLWTSASSELEFVSVQSQKAEGLKSLTTKIFEALPEHPAYYSDELFTTQTLRELASEQVRASCFELLNQEIPYGIAIQCQSFEEGEKIFKIEADIVLSKESHKGIAIGKGGAMLKAIGTRARMNLEKQFSTKVFLKLHVKVRTHWMKDNHWLQELGYVS